MSRLIDADKLKKHYAWWNNEEKKVFDDIVDLQPTVDAESLITRHEDIGYERGYRDGYAEALEATDNAEPVKQGHWIPTEQTPDFEWECSVCGNGFTNNKLSYCYDCGARMDESTIGQQNEVEE